MHGNSRTPLFAAAAIGVAAIALVAGLSGGSGSGSKHLAPVTVPSSVTAAGQVADPAATVPATADSAAPVSVPDTVAPSTVPAVPDRGCAAQGHSAGVDRDVQQAWLCTDGRVTKTFPISSAWSMPDPGTYQVYAKDLNSSSTFGGHYSTMTHFVAFSYGKNTGARVAFHSVPILQSGEYVQPLSSVGDLSRRGESSGCLRVLPDDAVLIWDTLQIGDTVTVVS